MLRASAGSEEHAGCVSAPGAGPMNGLSAAALLIGHLRRPPVPGLDEDLARRDAAVQRLALMLLLQLALFLGLTLR